MTVSPTVCFCNGNRVWGGGEKWHLDAARAMAARGYRTILMAGKGTPLLERAGECPQLSVRPDRLSGLDMANPWRQAATRRFFRDNKVSRVVFGLPNDLRGGGPAARQAGVEGIFYRRGSALPVRNNLLNRYLYGQVLTGLIVNSRETERQVLACNQNLIDAARVHYLPNGIDVAAFDAGLDRATPVLRRDFDGLIIGNAGRLNGQKAQQYLVHMSGALRTAGLRHKLVLAGEGEERGPLEALVRELDLGGTVEFAGFLQEMSGFWRSIDVFVLSSLWEGFGYVLAEALLARKPVVAFDCSSNPEIVRHGHTGMLLPMPGQDEKPEQVGQRLAACVMEMYADPGRACRMAEAGREFCVRTFDQERCMDALERLLWPK